MSLAALALTTVVNPGADEFGGGQGGHGGHHDGPLHFGPFEFPRYGSVSGGFSWGVRDCRQLLASRAVTGRGRPSVMCGSGRLFSA
ncbi:hypothetical protein PV963_27350 [Streptomyces coeruleorubidus]|uniref:hypothetical protein n=1 Tax=Streptomyces coeruleorubidus TaxID=116188 RepID=UPI00237F4209|nr:hypothetical protein [Streptomyces coeruleorubidus]WDV53811.1 hypothetical protein PV963_27350 [Streptomyces coeruleorubidus]